VEVVENGPNQIAVRAHQPLGLNTTAGPWSILSVPGADSLIELGMIDASRSGRRKDLWIASVEAERLILCLFRGDDDGRVLPTPGCYGTGDQVREGDRPAWILAVETPGALPAFVHARSSDGLLVARAHRFDLGGARFASGPWHVSAQFTDGTGPVDLIGARLPTGGPGLIYARADRELLVLIPMTIDDALTITDLPVVRSGTMMAEGGAAGFGRLVGLPTEGGTLPVWFRTDSRTSLVALPFVARGPTYAVAAPQLVGNFYGEWTDFQAAHWDAATPGLLYAFTRAGKLSLMHYRWDSSRSSFGAVSPSVNGSDYLEESIGQGVVGVGRFDSVAGTDAFHSRTADGIPIFKTYLSDGKGRHVLPVGWTRIWQ
jgi:hypothetical protein